MVGLGAPAAVEFIDERTRCVDQHFGRGTELLAGVDIAKPGNPSLTITFGGHQLDVVRSCCAGIQGRTNEGKDESGVIVDEVRVAVLDSSPH